MPLSPEQHAIRRGGISGSEIAAVAGLNPWAGPIDVWRSKVEPMAPLDEELNHNLLRGNLFEEPVISGTPSLRAAACHSPGPWCTPPFPW